MSADGAIGHPPLVAQMGGDIRQEIATGRVEMVKWCFLFWIGQLVTIASIVGIMMRLIRGTTL